jgi:hypothetical protein
VERGIKGRFKKWGKGKRGRIKQRDWINKLNLVADFAVMDCVVKLVIIGQRV